MISILGSTRNKNNNWRVYRWIYLQESDEKRQQRKKEKELALKLQEKEKQLKLKFREKIEQKINAFLRAGDEKTLKFPPMDKYQRKAKVDLMFQFNLDIISSQLLMCSAKYSKRIIR